MTRYASKPKEAEILRSILEYLAVCRIFHYRNNSGATTREYGGKTHFFRFGTPGSPDIVAVVNGQYVGIEVKAIGGKQNDNQIEFEKNLIAAGGRYILAYSIDDVEAGLSSLQRAE